jgi:hypothetical protein
MGSDTNASPNQELDGLYRLFFVGGVVLWLASK